MIKNQNRFEATLQLFDDANGADPNQEQWDNQWFPKELLYAQRMTEWLNRVYPDASEALQLAARSQHICRWESPRDAYPMDKAGYHQWRRELQDFHANKAGELMLQAGYEPDTIQRVKDLLHKKSLRLDPECQQLEDVICLVFLAYYFAEFAAKHTDDKVIDILQKTWKKMTPKGQAEAMKIQLPAKAESLLQQALS